MALDGSLFDIGKNKFQSNKYFMNILTFSEVFLNKDNSSWDSATFSMLEDVISSDSQTNMQLARGEDVYRLRH